jgi:hypothetical protein
MIVMPSSCGGQDVIVARAGLGDDAGIVSDAGVVGDAEAGSDARDGAAYADGEAGSFCSPDRPVPWWCAYDGAASVCHLDAGAGSLCSAAADAHAGPPPTEGGAGQICSSNDDCVSGAFCAKTSCGAGMGECQQRPVPCDDDSEDAGSIVCGCDGVNYWNDCLRKRDGVASSTPGQCTSEFATCGGTPEKLCPAPDAFCFIEATGECTNTTEGICWVLPDGDCSDAGITNWQSCDSTHDCVNLCTAIQSGTPHVRAGMGCQ